jgi:uncharacterized protein with von Willebrand factor type A (vWA) domain
VTGRLAENVLHFVRLLRACGLPVGPAKLLDALAAVQAVGVDNRADFRGALAAVLVSRHEHLAIFEQAFDLFWRNPGLLEKIVASLLPQVHGRSPRSPHASRRHCCRRARIAATRTRTRWNSTPRSRSRRGRCCSARTLRR